MELFILYQAVLCLIVATLGIGLGWVLGTRRAQQPTHDYAHGSSALEQAGITTDGTSLETWLSITSAVKELTDAEKERIKRFVLAGTTLEEKGGAPAEEDPMPRFVRRPYQRKVKGWEAVVADWVSEQTEPFTSRTAIEAVLRLPEEKITQTILIRMGMALRKIGCTRIGTGSATCLYVPPQSAHPEPHHESPARHESRHTRPSRIDTPAGSGPASTQPLQAQAQTTQAAFSAPLCAAQPPSL